MITIATAVFVGRVQATLSTVSNLVFSLDAQHQLVRDAGDPGRSAWASTDRSGSDAPAMGRGAAADRQPAATREMVHQGAVGGLGRTDLVGPQQVGHDAQQPFHDAPGVHPGAHAEPA